MEDNPREDVKPSIVLHGNVIERCYCDGCGKLLIKPHPILYTPEDGRVYCQYCPAMK